MAGLSHLAVIIIIWLAAFSIFAFAAMGIDKLCAKKDKHRIPESTLFLLAIVGGSIGAILGMYLFRHKTKHKSFVIGMPLVLLLQLAIVIWLIWGGR